MRMLFKNRREAGQRLANALTGYATDGKPLVLALPRGGVPVAYEVARQLKAPLDVFLVRKLGVPGQEELAFGAIASGGIRVLNTDLVRSMHLSQKVIEEITAREQQELKRREEAYRNVRPTVEIQGKTVFLIDDGLATGATMRAAAQALRQQKPTRVIAGVPVAAESTCEQLGKDVDAVVCTATPEPFYGVGRWYEDFSQTTDDEVKELLHRAAMEDLHRKS
ncbi:phosphoribosyltransferase [Larkinella harenae]